MLVLTVAPGIAIAQPAWGASPTEVLETFFGGANAILRSADPERGTEAPRHAIRALVNEIFDYQDAAARALGPAWQSRTPSQQAEFVRLFADFLERGYIAFVGTKANVSDGMQIRYLEESITGDSAAVATSLLTRNGSDLDVDYFMVRRGGRWMIRDVVVDGMSLIANYRAQFNRILNTSSYTELVARMLGDTLEVPQPAIAAAGPAAPMEQVAMVAQVPPAAQVLPAAQVPKVAPAPTVTPAPTVAQPAAAAAQPAKPTSPPAVVVPVVTAPPVARQEVRLAARPVEVAAPKVEVIRVSAPEPAIPVRAAFNGASGVAASHYWIQVGAFRTVGAAVQLAERLRRLGMAASNDPLTSAPGHPAGALARVRVGPFATHSDAKSKLRELIARGYTPFIAEARH
jgi:phospholipid transport system substrate-binding protein